MWARLTPMLVAAAVGMAGCAAQMDMQTQPIARVSAIDAGELEELIGLIAEGRYEEASSQIPSLAARFESRQERPRAAESLFWLGYCYEKLDRPAEAAQIYGRVLKDYPQEPAARQAAQRLALIPRPTANPQPVPGGMD